MGDGGATSWSNFPGGVYACAYSNRIVEPNGSINPKLAGSLASPNVNGFYLQINWSKVEPTMATSPSGYVWSSLLTDLQALPAGKSASISIHAGAAVPSWFCTSYPSECVSMHHYDPANMICVSGAIPVPFPSSTHFIDRFGRVIDSLGAALAANPTLSAKVAMIKLGGVDAYTDEVELPFGLECGTYDETAAWQTLGYTSGQVFTVWQTFVSHYAAAFPNQFLDIQLALGFPPLNGDTTGTLYSQMVNYLLTTYGKRAVFQGQGLKDAGGIQPIVESAAAQGSRIGMQAYIDVATHTSEMANPKMCYPAPPATSSNANLLIKGMVDFAQATANGSCNPGVGNHPVSFFELYTVDIDAYDSMINGYNVIQYANQQVAP